MASESEEVKLEVYRLLTNDPYPSNYKLKDMFSYLLDIHDIRSIELALRQVYENKKRNRGNPQRFVDRE